jgi:hypothetical protein
MAGDYKYNVFISYSHKDEDWVVDTFFATLEIPNRKVTGLLRWPAVYLQGGV